MLIVDEADLTFSYGFEEDMRRLMPHLPRIYQAILVSATLSPDVVTLKKLVLHNPVSMGGGWRRVEEGGGGWLDESGRGERKWVS